jgi:aryl-alcohol dehydrogenase-like predicted oxidoreductase
VALNWVTHRPTVVSTLIGATKLDQLEKNLHALDFVIPEGLNRKLEEASRPILNELDHFFDDILQGMIHGGVPVKRLV